MTNATAQFLARAIHRWLAFQVLCQREMLLSESYLAQPVGEFLRAHHSGPIRAEWNHPNLQNAGRGRPRQIDYVLFSKTTNRATSAIEAKWVADTASDRQRIIDDILRLECLRNIEGQHMTRYFLIAGRTPHFAANFTELEINVGNGRQAFLPPFLPLVGNDDLEVQVLNCQQQWRKYYKSFQTSYAVPVPRRFWVRPIATEADHSFTVRIWEVGSTRHRTPFSPAAEWPEIQVPLNDADEEQPPVA